MKISKIKLIYFSPTGTTLKTLESIAEGFNGKSVEHINLTLPAGDAATAASPADELVIFGAPVYGGRLPVDAISRFRHIKGTKTPAVVVVVYGNREFEDSLLELKNLAIELGFCPVAGGAFIGEHSFATKDAPIASGRPDSLDVQKARDFGARIKEKIVKLQSIDNQLELNVPGRFPYEGGARVMTIAPLTDEDKCTLCGTCATVCPTAAISINESVTTAIEGCIRCCACIKICPEEARFWQDAMMTKFTTYLTENCSERKEPLVFLAEM